MATITGKCKKCSKRTQGKNSNKEFLCRNCGKKEEYENITNHLNNMNKFDFGWLIGFVEGEGCFYCKGSNCKISSGHYCYPLSGFALMSTDLDIMNHFSKLLDVELRGPYYKTSKQDRKIVWSVQITGNKVMSIMNVLRPHLGQRRQEQIDKAIAWQERGKFKICKICK